MSKEVPRQPLSELFDLQATLSDLDDLVRIRSVGGQEEPAQRAMVGLMRAAGMQVDEWQIDLEALRRHPSFCEEICRDHALGVVGRLRGSGSGPALMFAGHVDVVDAGAASEWSVPPWELTVREGRAYGRGAVDMKGGLIAAIEAVRMLQRAGVQLRGDLLLASVVGEEDGGTGALATMERGYRPDAAVIMEPTGLAVAPAHAGALNFRIRLHGRSAHGCVRSEGVSAIGLLPPVLEALERLEAARNRRLQTPLFDDYEIPFALCVGRVRGGDWPSSVAETLELEGRYGIAPGEPLADARAEFEAAIRVVADAHPWMREHGPTVHWWGGRFEPAAIDGAAPIVGAVTGAFAAATGDPARVTAMTYGADMRLLVNDYGIDTVLFGPGDVRAAHRPDEYVPVDDLRAVATTLALTAIDLCGVAAD